jgi:hypothetical protein
MIVPVLQTLPTKAVDRPKGENGGIDPGLVQTHTSDDTIDTMHRDNQGNGVILASDTA